MFENGCTLSNSRVDDVTNQLLISDGLKDEYPENKTAYQKI